MEFDLGEGTHHVHVGGVNAEMELPASFKVLPREDQVQAQLAADFFQRIVATDREGSKVTLVTAIGEIFVLRAGDAGLPDGDVHPGDFGKKITVGDFEALSSWILALSTKIISVVDLFSRCESTSKE